MSSITLPIASFLDTFSGSVQFIFEPRTSEEAGSTLMVGGLDQILDLLASQALISFIALGIAIIVALPLGVYLGHRGVGEFAAIAVGNAGRAVPELALIALMIAFVGTGALNVTIAVMILGIPPILTNAFVGIRQVDRGAVEAARGVGMTEWEIVRKVELPLAVPTIMGGVRTGAVNIVATSTIGSIAGVETFGKLILGPNVYGDEGVLAGAIMVAVLALAFEFGLAGIQRLLTPRGIKSQQQLTRATA